MQVRVQFPSWDAACLIMDDLERRSGAPARILRGCITPLNAWFVLAVEGGLRILREAVRRRRTRGVEIRVMKSDTLLSLSPAGGGPWGPSPACLT